MTQLVFAASHRPASLNRKLAALAVRELERHTAVEFVEYGSLDLPIYDDADAESRGIPANVQAIADKIKSVSGLVIASPEYNWSCPGSLKNLIDWLSRVRPVPLAGKTALLMAASSSMVGGIRGLLHLRVPLEALGVYVHPRMFTVARAGDEFDDAGEFKTPLLKKNLGETVADYARFASAIKG